MVGEIADYVSKHKAKTASFSPKKVETKRPGSVGDLGKSLEQNDPETLKFIKRHDTTIHGEKPEVATKYALDTPQNERMKPEEGVYEEEEMEEAAKCPKCGAADCTCQHEECQSGSGKKKLKTGKLKEYTLCNMIAMELLEDMKVSRLEEKKFDVAAKKLAGPEGQTRLAKAPLRGIAGGGGEVGREMGTYSQRSKAAKDKLEEEEGVDCSVHKVSPSDPDYTGGMHVHTKPKAEVATGHKPAVAATEKSKKLARKEVKEAHHHHEPMPKLDNPSHGSGCTGHEDPMIHIKKPQSDPTKIPNMNKPGNSTQPKSGVLDKKKSKVSEEIASEGVMNWLDRQVKAHQGQWAGRPAPAVPKPKKVPKGYVPAKQEKQGGLNFDLSKHGAKWQLEGGKKKVNEGVFNRVSDPQLRKQSIGKANKLDAPQAVVPPPKTGTSKVDLMTSLAAIRKKANEEVIDEISKGKAADYIGSSSADYGDRNAGSMINIMKGKSDKDNQRKIGNRYKGILKASNKLAGRAKVPAQEEVENIEELSKNTLSNYRDKAKSEIFNNKLSDKKSDNRFSGANLAARKMSGHAKVLSNEEVELKETLPASASASDYIHDFVHSKNKVFKGDTKKKRIKRALGAYYHKKHE